MYTLRNSLVTIAGLTLLALLPIHTSAQGQGTLVKDAHTATQGQAANNNYGFTVSKIGSGDYSINFGLTINDRFYSVSVQNTPNSGGKPVGVNISAANPTQLFVQTFETHTTGVNADRPFWVIVF